MKHRSPCLSTLLFLLSCVSLHFCPPSYFLLLPASSPATFSLALPPVSLLCPVLPPASLRVWLLTPCRNLVLFFRVGPPPSVHKHPPHPRTHAERHPGRGGEEDEKTGAPRRAKKGDVCAHSLAQAFLASPAFLFRTGCAPWRSLSCFFM